MAARPGPDPHPTARAAPAGRGRAQAAGCCGRRGSPRTSYPSVDRAADAVPRILECERQPVALEGLDHRLITDQQLHHWNAQALNELPEGAAYLMVQFGGHTRDEVDQS